MTCSFSPVRHAVRAIQSGGTRSVQIGGGRTGSQDAIPAIWSGGTRSVQIGRGCTGSQDVGLVARQIDYCGRLRNTCAAVHDDVHGLARTGTLWNRCRLSRFRPPPTRCWYSARAARGPVRSRGKCGCPAPGFLPSAACRHELRHVSRSFQNEGIGPGEKAFHHAVGRIGNVLRVPGEITQIRADETERLPGGSLLDLVDPVDGLAVEYIAAQSIDRVRSDRRSRRPGAVLRRPVRHAVSGGVRGGVVGYRPWLLRKRGSALSGIRRWLGRSVRRSRPGGLRRG